MRHFRWIPASLRAEHLLVGLLCILFALSLGVYYGISEQNIYLLPGLHLASPSFLATDWYTTKTADHHIAFTYLVCALQKIGPLPWTSAVLYLLLKAVLAVSAYIILAALYDCPFPPFLLSMPLLFLVVGTSNPLSHRFFAPCLVPYGIATALFLAGVASLTCAVPGRPSRYALSGGLFGLSGLFHGTFLFLIPVFLAGVWVVLPRRFSLREVAAFGVPFLALTIPIGWTVFTQFDFGEGSLGRLDALLRFNVPRNHLPRTWGVEGFALFAGHLALGAIGLYIRWPTASRSSIPLAASSSLLGLFLFVLFSTVAIFVPQIAMLQAFHVVSILSFFCLLFFAGAAAQEVASARKPFSTHRLIRVILLGVGLFIVYESNPAIGTFLAVLLGACLIGAQSRLSVQTYTVFARRLLFCGATLFLLGLTGFSLPLSTAFFAPYEFESSIFRWVHGATPKEILYAIMRTKADDDLCGWARTATPGDALFVVPPEMERFRLRAQRSIVVDWKGFPYRTQDAEEWYRRIVAVSGIANPTSKQEVLFGYLSMNSEHARALARAFGAQYVVIRLDRHLGDLSQFRKIYSNGVYAVYRIEEMVSLHGPDATASQTVRSISTRGRLTKGTKIAR